MTIYDISEKAGVSIATVSRVLNGSAKVSPATRKKVLDVIDACGYAPNAFARGLGLRSLRTIGILCADSSDLFLAKAVYYHRADAAGARIRVPALLHRLSPGGAAQLHGSDSLKKSGQHHPGRF